MKNLIKFESFNREGNVIDFDIDDDVDVEEPTINYDDTEAHTIEFDIPTNDEAWHDIYNKFLHKNKNNDNSNYNQWLIKNYYAPVKK
jgi:hypothetical protein